MSEDYDEINYNSHILKGDYKNNPVDILRNKLKYLHPGYLLKKDDLLETPDFLYKSKKVAIYVLSDFWHDCNNVDMNYCVETKKDFWTTRIKNNIEKYDQIRIDKINQGYKVLFINKSEISDELDECLNKITHALNG